MVTTYTKHDNEVFDHIVMDRRTHRRFKQDIPPAELIKDILKAGLHAPYAGAAVGNTEEYFRRFFVLKKVSHAMSSLIPLFFNEVIKTSTELEAAMEHNKNLRDQATGFVTRLEMIKKMGMVPGIGTAPYVIITAEKKGFPPVEHQSLAHSMENMWLKATALGLGYQLVSITSQMSDNEEFCRILGLKPGVWAFIGCAIGYPAEELSPSSRPPVDELTTWLE
jgi:nitroreductase